MRVEKKRRLKQKNTVQRNSPLRNAVTTLTKAEINRIKKKKNERDAEKNGKKAAKGEARGGEGGDS